MQLMANIDILAPVAFDYFAREVMGTVSRIGVSFSLLSEHFILGISLYHIPVMR